MAGAQIGIGDRATRDRMVHDLGRALDDEIAIAVLAGPLDDLIALAEIGRAHVGTPVTNAHLVCRLLLEKKKNNTAQPYNTVVALLHTYYLRTQTNDIRQ